MADGKVRINAVLDTEQADKAAQAFQDRILNISTAMTKAVDTSMRQLDSEFKRIEKNATSSTNSANNSKTIKAETNSVTSLENAYQKANKQVKAGQLTFAEYAKTLSLVRSGLNDVNGAMMQLNITNSKAKSLSYLSTSEINQLQDTSKSFDFSNFDYRQIEQAIKVIQNQMTLLEGSGRESMQPFIDRLKQAQNALKDSKKSTDELALAQQKLNDIAFGAQVKSQFETPIGSDEQLAKMREYYEEQEKLSAQAAESQQKKNDAIFGAQVESLYQQPVDYQFQQNQLRQMYAEQEQAAQAQLKTAQGISQMDERSIDDINKKVQAYEEYLRKLDLSDDLGKQEYQSISKTNEELRERLKIMQKMPELSSIQVSQMEENSINQRNNKIREYQRLLNNVNTTTKQGKIEAQQYTSAIQRLNDANTNIVKVNQKSIASFGSLGNAFENLTNRIIAYGAISAIQNFGRQLIEVTGQFEQTRIALGAIIGDMDEAQRQFDLIQQQALKSPFSIMELTDTTKMLAAYGYEASELNNTMNMMADLSAGVGVEMSRLAYNMGQIRAQTVLNNRDARDFASAGIPILGALAEKYSELEGRLISTGEVFDMVSARMVSAADVQEVLNDMVSEGGMFYQMQEQLADSLRGRVSNLTDAFHIMYDEIGTAGYGAIRGSVDILIELVKNWEKVATAIFVVVGAFGTYKAAMLLINSPLIKYIALSSKAALSTGTHSAALTKLAAANLATAKSQGVLNKALTSIKSINPYAVAAAAVIGLGVAIYSAYRNATQLQRELSKIEADGQSELITSINNFQRLADTISDTSRPIQETNKAFEDLKRIYGDILPPQTLQIEKIREMAGEYGVLTAAITDAKNAEILRNQESAITASFSEPIAKAQEDLTEYLKKQGAGEIGITQFYLDIQKQIEDGSFNTAMSIDEQNTILQQSFARFTGIQFDFSEIATRTIDPLMGITTSYDTLNENILTFINTIQKQNRELSKVRIEAENARGSFGDLADSYREITKEGGLADKVVQNLISTTNALTLEGITFDTKFEFNEAVTRANAAALISETEKAIQEQFKLDIDLGEGSTLIDANSLTQQLVGATESQKTAIYAIYNDLFQDIGNILPSNLIKVVNDSVKDAADTVGVSFDEIDKYLRNNEESTEQWSKKIVEGYDAAVSTLAEYQTLNEIALGQGNEPVYSSEQISALEQEIALRKILIDQYNLQAKSTEKEEDKQLKQLKQLKSRIDMINRVRKAYEDVYKATGDANESAESITKTFGASFSKLFKDSGIELSDIITFDDSKIVKQISKLGESLKGIESKEYVAKIVEEYRIDIITTANKASLDQAQKEIDNLIKNYQLGVTLGEAGEFGNILKGILGSTDDIDFTVNFDKFIEDANSAINKVKKELQDVDYEGDVSRFETALSTATTDEQKAAIQNELDAYKKAYEDRVKFVEKSEKQVQDITIKEANERVEYYNTLLEKEGTFQEKRLAIIRKAEEDRAKIQKDTSISEPQRESLTTAVSQRETADISALNFEEFQQSAEWVAAFGEMEGVSINALNQIMAKFKEFRLTAGANLSTTDLKTYEDALEKLRDNIIEKSPFDTLAKSFQKINDAQKELSEADTDEERFNATIKLNSAYEEQEDAMTTVIGSLQDMVTGFDFLNELLGDQGQIAVESMFAVASSAVAVASAVRTAEKASVILAAISAALTVVQAIVNVFPSQNKKITAELESSQYAVERLQQAYSQLEREVESSLGSAEIAAKKALVANLELQKVELERQLALAKSREGKKYDQEEVDGILDELQDVNNKIADTTQSIVDDVFGSVKDLATSTAEVWLEMWRNGEDALQGIRDSFKDTMQQMIIDAIMAKAIEGEVAKIWKGVESALEDNIIDDSEWKKINDDIEAGTVRMDEILKKLAETYGIAFGEGVDSEDETSDLTRGIQSITEDTALALEGLLAIIVSNSFINMGNIQKTAEISEALLAVNNQMLFEIRQGNITRRSMLTIMQAITDPSGVMPVNVKLI